MNATQSFGGKSGGTMVKTSPGTFSLLKAMRIAGGALFAVLLLAVSAMGARAAGTNQKTFSSPEQAGEALATVWRSGGKADLLKIFGPAGVKLVSSGDDIADKEVRTRLAAAYDAQHRVENEEERRAQLVIGKNEFPFPIPLVKVGNVWRFDTKAGEDEILNRRIGRNELNAIEVCRAYVESQREYATEDRLGNGVHGYAMRIRSTDGKRDGLYWPAMAGEEESPLGPLIARASAGGYSAASPNMLSPYHGYYYRILTRQGANAPGGASNYITNGHMTGGFALVAFPAKYGNSGIMTFIVNQDGIVFQKNLGPDTAKIARQMTEYNPDQTWNTP